MKCRYLIVAWMCTAATAAALLTSAGAQQSAGQPSAGQPAAGQPASGPAGAAPATAAEPVFDQAFMSNAENIKKGEAVWSGQCRHCHGAAAYPGKAPKLNPATMEPDFIFDRVTNGFQKMPPWKDVFSEQERMNVVAYIKSKEFSP